MANTFTSLHYHIVFSTKNREPLVTRDIEQRVWEFLGGIARQNKMKALRVGGMEDHIHMLVGAPPTIAPFRIARLVKGGSSGWIKAAFPHLRKFSWQDGYGGFTVSKSHVPEVSDYIDNQRKHHSNRSFKQEFLGLLKKHDIEYDLKHVFD
jgi:REP element-mobilizing transposase RayT